MKTFKLYTLGCKVNQYETQAIREDFISAGFSEVNLKKPADIYVINSCTVTGRADSKSLDLIRKARQENPLAKIILTGCLVSGKDAKMYKKLGADLIVSNQWKNQLVGIVKSKKPIGKKATSEFLPLKISGFKGHSRVFVKIQDGCNNICAYCKIPLVRGKSRSRPLSDIKKEVERLVKKGFKEIVLTGICLGDYGSGLPIREGRLIDITDVIEELEKIKAGFRVRLSSIEAKDISQRLIEKLSKSKRLCRHLHIPFQSGDNEILKKMQRKYSVSDYLLTVKKLRKKIPDIAITTDIMVGFPAEKERNFKNTLRFVEQVSPSRTHIFPFSPRPGTSAWGLSDRIPTARIKKREELVRELADRMAQDFYREFKNHTLTVLTEHRRDKQSGLLKGYSENYIPVKFSGSDNLMGELVKIKVKQVKEGYILGQKL
ncbi:MAG: tRNA (N(6)-L-threonylcarbamoyladenosine(37)-C(2))-methylthiotransferase MtaB [Candidatus Omnitrophota bacterium]|nr:tRNA (N(6)-L-threonylcarbamoyladenosine(37)-C(2))-methylthiotransferase MtaB [Candidatus Omnitrophota bacterium]